MTVLAQRLFVPLLFLALGPNATSAAERLSLDSLRGKSIDAGFLIVEPMVKLNRDLGKYTEHITRRIQIYVSTTGQVFDRDYWNSNNGHNGHWDQVSATGDPNLVFVEDEGFRRVNLDAPTGQKSTFAIRVEIPVRRTELGFSCKISMIYALRQGESEYIKPSWDGNVWKVLSHQTLNPHCKVIEGNVFVGSD